jgi:hypothetical protein
MTYEGISFEIRAGLGRNEWTFLIAYPDRAEHFVTQINGSRDDAIGAAHKRIDTWLRWVERVEAYAPNSPRSVG